MTRAEVEERVCQALSLVLKQPFPPHRPVLRAEIPTWDSLSHVEIIYAVEESLDVMFSEEELATLDGSVAIVDAVERHRAA